MNQYTEKLNRIEFVVTLACTGKCRHCSQGDHINCREHIDGDEAAKAVSELCREYKIESLMTFGGEPLLFLNDVCKIHSSALRAGIPQRELITNGFFSKDESKIRSAVDALAQSGVNKIMLSADAFHQETIPLEPVKLFAQSVRDCKIEINVHPAWLVSEDDCNPYNIRTRGILKEFSLLGIDTSSGNVIFPSGNAVKYLGEYFDSSKTYESPYKENPFDIRAISVSPDGSVLNGNIYDTAITTIVENYIP